MRWYEFGTQIMLMRFTMPRLFNIAHSQNLRKTVVFVLWLLGFFAFHVTNAFLHIVLVVGLILIVLQFARRGAAACRARASARSSTLG